MKNEFSDIIFVRGNKVRYNERGELFDADTLEPIEFFDPDTGESLGSKFPGLDISRVACPRCGRPSDGHDNCLGYLPGVYFACCGHGAYEGYIYFRNGIVIRGNFKASMEKEWIKYKPKFEIEK